MDFYKLWKKFTFIMLYFLIHKYDISLRKYRSMWFNKILYFSMKNVCFLLELFHDMSSVIWMLSHFLLYFLVSFASGGGNHWILLIDCIYILTLHIIIIYIFFPIFELLPLSCFVAVVKILTKVTIKFPWGWLNFRRTSSWLDFWMSSS